MTRIPYYMAGTPCHDLASAVKAVGFSIVSEPVARLTTGKEIPGTQGLYRSDSGFCLGIHGKGYTYVQPAESLAVLDEARQTLRDAGHDAKWASVRTVNRGQSLAGFINLSHEIKAPKRGDAMGLFLSWSESFDGTAKRRFALGINVLACTNGAMSRRNLCAYASKHTKNSGDGFAVWRGTLAMNLQMEIQAMQEMVTKLDGTPITAGEVEAFARHLFGVPINAKPEEISAQNQTKLSAIVSGFSRGMGNQGQTRWDAFNAVTEYLDHGANYRETENSKADNRFASLMAGDGANVRDRALALLLN